MAPPYTWYDRFVDCGWPHVLTPAALRLLLTIGRYVNSKSLRTPMKIARLLAETRLPRSTFFEAKGDLEDYKIATREKEAGKWMWILASPPPAIPAESPLRRTKRSEPPDYSVRTTGPIRGGNAGRTRASGDGQQQYRTQLGKQYSPAALQLLALRLEGVGGRERVGEEELAAVLRGARVVQTSLAQLEEVAFTLSRELQAAGVLAEEKFLWPLLPEVAALLEPAKMVP